MSTETQTSSSNRRLLLIAFAVINVIWLLNFGVIHTYALSRYGSHPDWGIPLLNEFTGTYSAFLLLPILYLLWKNYPLTKSSWFKLLPLYLLVTVLVGALHTTMMMVSREVLYPFFDLGDHDPGKLTYRYAMEFQKQIFWIWGTIGFLALLRHLRAYHDSRLHAVRLKEQLVQSRLDVMRQQINPHFLFNSLNLISSKVYEDAEEADLLITELADLLRASLEMGKQSTVSLDKELSFVDKYIHIMKERFGDRVAFSKEVDPACMQIEVPSLILQPVIENSFKHRLEADSSDLHIRLSARSLNDSLEIEIVDESPIDINKADPDKAANGGGVGLSNIRSRLETMYGSEASIVAGPANSKQFKVTIQLPVSSSSLQSDG
ncbi:MAG: sensor histidine kinase [Puniceicoccaceae bacterium]